VETHDLVRQLLRHAHTLLARTLAECPEEIFYRVLPDATIASIAAIYAHVVIGEDRYMQKDLGGGSPLCDSPAWSSRFRFSPQSYLDPEWAAGLRYDRAAFDDYAASVFEASDVYLAGLSVAELDRTVEMTVSHFTGDRWIQQNRPAPLAFAVIDMVPLHIHEHAGEIAALKGVERLR
jgi:hypothetical protein